MKKFILHKTVEKHKLFLYPSLENANVITLPTNDLETAQGAHEW